MIDFIKKNRVWLLYVTYILAIPAVFMFVLKPQALDIKDKADKSQESFLEKQILEKRLSGLTEMEKRYAHFNAYKGELGKMIGKGEEVEFIRFLEDLAREIGQEISIKIPEDKDVIKGAGKKVKSDTDSEGRDILNSLPEGKYLFFEITLLGGYPEAVEYVEKLENSEYYSNVVSISMEKVEKQNIQSSSEAIFSPASPDENKKEEALKTVIGLIAYKK